MHPDTEGCQAYIFDMDESKSPLLLHLRSEVHHRRAMLHGCASLLLVLMRATRN